MHMIHDFFSKTKILDRLLDKKRVFLLSSQALDYSFPSGINDCIENHFKDMLKLLLFVMERIESNKTALEKSVSLNKDDI